MKFPERITIELTNKCNRQCDMCPRLKMKYPLGDMSISLLKNIAYQIPKEVPIIPFFRGESVLHPSFIEAMKIFRKFDSVSMATNGDGLTENKKSAMLDTCSFISYSVHEFGYPHDHFGMAEYLALAKSIGIETQVSIVNTVIPNEEKKNKFIKEWLVYVDRVRIYIEHSHEGFGDIENKPIMVLQPCHKVFSDMVIYWDGKVALCNHDWDNFDPVGDVNVQSIDEIWNGNRYLAVRKLHRNAKFKIINSCKDCDQWMVDYLPEKLFGELYTSEMN